MYVGISVENIIPVSKISKRIYHIIFNTQLHNYPCQFKHMGNNDITLVHHFFSFNMLLMPELFILKSKFHLDLLTLSKEACPCLQL